MADFRIRRHEVVTATVHDPIRVKPARTSEIARPTTIRRRIIGERALIQVIDGQQSLFFPTLRMLLETFRTTRTFHGLQIVSMRIRKLGPSRIQVVHWRAATMRRVIWAFFIVIAIVEVSHTYTLIGRRPIRWEDREECSIGFS